MNPNLRRFQLGLLIASAALAGGCQAILEDLALQPYDNALRQGRMLPDEYRRTREQLERAASGQLPPSRPPTK